MHNRDIPNRDSVYAVHGAMENLSSRAQTLFLKNVKHLFWKRKKLDAVVYRKDFTIAFTAAETSESAFFKESIFRIECRTVV